MPSSAAVSKALKPIMAFTDQYNHNSTPFVWVATAQSILEKLATSNSYLRDTTLAACGESDVSTENGEAQFSRWGSG